MLKFSSAELMMRTNQKLNKGLNQLYLRYLRGEICDRQFSHLVDDLIVRYRYS